MKTVIEMAREAGWKDLRDYDSEMRHDFFMGNTDSLERLVELARADERNRTWTQKHWTEYERSIVEAEREAIAQSLDKQADLAPDEIDRRWAQEMAAAVRARSQK